MLEPLLELDTRIHLGRKASASGPTTGFHLVHGGVGVFEKCFYAVTIIGKKAKADTGSYRDNLSIENKGLPEQGIKRLHSRLGVLGATQRPQ